MRICAVILAIVLVAEQGVGAQGPVSSLVSRAELDAALQSATNRRAMNLQKIRRVLEDDETARTAKGVADVTRLSNRLAGLDDRTLERLAAESDKVSQQQSHGRTGKVLLIILLSLVILAMLASAYQPSS